MTPKDYICNDCPNRATEFIGFGTYKCDEHTDLWKERAELIFNREE